jgi:hypothetical protein
MELSVPSDESLGYSHEAPPGRNVSKMHRPIIYLKFISVSTESDYMLTHHESHKHSILRLCLEIIDRFSFMGNFSSL